jgi:hypothetical protein
MFKNPLATSLSKKQLTKKCGLGYQENFSGCLLNQEEEIDDVDNYYNASDFKRNDYVAFEFNDRICYARVVYVINNEICFYLLNKISYEVQQA